MIHAGKRVTVDFLSAGGWRWASVLCLRTLTLAPKSGAAFALLKPAL